MSWSRFAKDPRVVARARTVGRAVALAADLAGGLTGGVAALGAVGRALAGAADELDELPHAGVGLRSWVVEALMERMTTAGADRAYVAGPTRVFWTRAGTWRITYTGPVGTVEAVTDEVMGIIWSTGPVSVDMNWVRPWDPVSTGSELERTVADELRPFVRARRGRGVMLHGPPGTGKTTVAWGAAARLRRDGDARRIALVAADTHAIANAVDLAPSVVVIDDLDRLMISRDDGALAVQGDAPSFPASVLADLGRLRSAGASLIVTTNRTDRVDDAVLRAQRIDRSILVERVPDDVFAVVTAGFPPAVLPVVRDWTVADLRSVRDEVEVAGRDAGVVVERMLRERGSSQPAEN